MDKEKFISMLDADGGKHYPFQGIIESRTGELALLALAVPTIQVVYAAAKNAFLGTKDPVKLYFTADFPAMREIKTDFIGCMFWERASGWSGILIPYEMDGTLLPHITDTPTLTGLLYQTRAMNITLSAFGQVGSLN